MCATGLSEKREHDGAMRQACRRCRWVHYPHVAISVTAVIVLEGKTVLVQRRSEPGPGTWIFPAGFLEYGELPEVGVLRELQEETNLTAKLARLIAMQRSEGDPREPNHMMLVYQVIDIDGELKNNPAENLAAAWFPIDHLPEIKSSNHQQVAHMLRSLNS